jgi:hypothetical protein
MSPTRHCLGGLLPRQQADRPQTIPRPALLAKDLYPLIALRGHRLLLPLSRDYDRGRGMYLRVTNPFATCNRRSAEFTKTQKTFCVFTTSVLPRLLV